MNVTLAQIFWVALGGSLGAVSRFMLSSWLNEVNTSAFPWGTYAVNVIGSCVFGVLFVLVFANQPGREELRLLVLVGFLGAFTTFSTFSFETVRLMESGLWLLALSNVLLSVITCVLGTWIGMGIARLLS